MRALLSKGADVNAQNDNGDTALHLAVAYGKARIAKTLLDGGADVAVLNKDGRDALLVASCHHHAGSRYGHYLSESELASFKENLNQVSSVSLLTTASTALSNEGRLIVIQGNYRGTRLYSSEKAKIKGNLDKVLAVSPG